MVSETKQQSLNKFIVPEIGNQRKFDQAWHVKDKGPPRKKPRKKREIGVNVSS